MKVLYVVSGIGYGDATREHANILALKKRSPGVQVMVAGYDNSYSYFKDKYDIIKIRGYKLPGKSMRINVWHFALRNIFLPAFWFVGTLKVRLQAFGFVPDVIVSDFEPVGISLGKVLFRDCVVVFGYDPVLYDEYRKRHNVNYKMKVEAQYFTRLYQQANLVLIPTFRTAKNKHMGTVYVPPIVRTLPEDLPTEKVLMKRLKLQQQPVLVMLGGSAFGTKLARHINTVARVMPKEQFIIFGGDLDLALSKNVSYIKFAPNFLQYLKVCKGVITLAGHKTLSEALVYKKPILCFPIQDHIEQTLNAYALEKVIMISHRHALRDVQRCVKKFLKDLAKIQKKVVQMNVKGDGADVVATLVLGVGRKHIEAGSLLDQVKKKAKRKA